MRHLQALVVAAVLLVPALPVGAQDRAQTLADVRQELSVLFVEIQQLRRELNTTEGVRSEIGGGSVLERIDAIEAELRRLTAKTEELEFRIERVVTDGTNRIGDLEFRLVELEGGDLGAIGQTPRLGGETAGGFQLPSLPAPQTDTDAADVPQLAASERDDFERARDALEGGDYSLAAERFGTFTETYPGGPLTVDAHYLRGQAFSGVGDVSRAARSYLDAFTAAPDGPRAPDALLRLGESLGELGQVEEACVMLEELVVRFPGAAVVPQAQEAQHALGCV